MSTRKQLKNRELTRERMQEIQIYLFSINGLVNPCMKDVTRRNVIGVESAKQVLKTLKEELKEYEIDMQLINLEEIYGNKERNTMSELICNLSDGFVKASYYKEYEEMIKGEELEKAYPESERRKRIQELEQEIEKQLQVTNTLEKVNPSLAKRKEKEIYLLEQEVASINDTLQMPTREYLTVVLYSAVVYKLNNLKEQCEYKLSYLEGILG